jgi:hypothetical protein
MSNPIAFVCSHGCAYTEEEMEMGMSFATLDAMMDAAQRDHDLTQDLATETELAREHVLDESDCPWPWYADAAYEIEEPEVIG